MPLVLAPVIGSFLGVLIRRLPARRGVVFGRSRCEHCDHPLGARDMWPIASFLLLGGRCRHCHAPIARAHLAIEIAALAVAAASLSVEAYARGDWERVWADCLLGWCLLALAWIDAEAMILPDLLTLPLILLGLVWSYVSDPVGSLTHAAAAISGYLMFRLIELGYRCWRGRDGLGQGDAKLLAAGGAWVGLAGLGPIILIAALIGLMLAGVMRLRGGNVGLQTRIPFGPCLAAGIWLVFLSS